ncbi:MAG: hypothetical protein WCO42_08540 [bacterium]
MSAALSTTVIGVSSSGAGVITTLTGLGAVTGASTGAGLGVDVGSTISGFGVATAIGFGAAMGGTVIGFGVTMVAGCAGGCGLLTADCSLCATVASACGDLTEFKIAFPAPSHNTIVGHAPETNADTAE